MDINYEDIKNYENQQYDENTKIQEIINNNSNNTNNTNNIINIINTINKNSININNTKI